MQTGYDTGQDVRQKAEQTASTLVDQASQVAQTQVTTQKDRAAETLGFVAQSIRDAGSGMREQQPQIASLAEQAAGRVEDVSSYIRDHEVGDLIGETERLARREPLLFLGGAFAIGFIAARFLKASSPKSGGQGSAFSAGRQGRYAQLSSGTDWATDGQGARGDMSGYIADSGYGGSYGAGGNGGTAFADTSATVGEAASTPTWQEGEAQADASGVTTTEFDLPDESEAARMAGLGDDADRR